MPKPRKPGSATTATSSKLEELGKLFAATAALADEDEECSTQDEPYYAGGFGTRRGTVCHCSRCLRRSGPLTDDPGQVVDDIIGFLEEVDPDGAFTGFEGGDIEEHHRVLAETISLAVERGDADVLRTILTNITDRAIQAELATRLSVPAAQHGHVQQILLLDEFDADFEEPDPARGGPPLMHAANNGHVGAVNALLECGADAEAADYQNQTALMVAVFSDRASAAETLLSRGAQVDAVDYKGRTALSHAARYGSLDCISVLAQYNADVFHLDKDGRTPIVIAEECSRFEAAAQLKRLQQRQRLRERKESRQKEVGPERKFDRLELMQKEAEALRHALALVEEEEVEAQKKAARKPKAAKKAKKKGKATTADGVADDAAAAPVAKQTPNVGDDAAAAVDRRSSGPTSTDDTAEASVVERSTSGADAVGQSEEVRRSATARINRAPGSEHAAGLKQILQFNGIDHAEPSKVEPEPPPQDPLVQLRESWDALLKEAASCKLETRQGSLLEEVRAMAETCAAAGISVKYGKKVIGKLEKAAPVRAALQEELQARLPNKDSLEAALEQARGLRSLLDDRLLADSEEKLQQLVLEQEEIRARQMQEAQTRPSLVPALQSYQLPAESSRPTEHSRAGIASYQHRPDEHDHQIQRQPGYHKLSGSAFPVNGRAHLPSSSILQSLGASPEVRSGRAPPLSAPQLPELHSRMSTTGIAGPARTRHQSGFSSDVSREGLAIANGFDSGQALRPRSELPVGSTRGSTAPSPAAANDGGAVRFPSPAPQMHDQGLANIWQRGPKRPGHELAGTSGFFSGSLFDAPLPIQSQPPSQQASLFSSAPQRSWSPLGPSPPNSVHGQDWLGELLGSVPAPTSRDSSAAQHPVDRRMDVWTRGYNGLPTDLTSQHSARDVPEVHRGTGDHRQPLWGTNSMNGGVQTPYMNGLAQMHSSPQHLGPRAPTLRWDVRGQTNAGWDAEECVVCMAAKQSCTCMPCGHRAMCGPCSSAVKNQSGLCPICRRAIQQLVAV